MITRHLRPNNVLGKLIPPLLVLLGVKGHSLVTFETCESPGIHPSKMD